MGLSVAGTSERPCTTCGSLGKGKGWWLEVESLRRIDRESKGSI